MCLIVLNINCGAHLNQIKQRALDKCPSPRIGTDRIILSRLSESVGEKARKTNFLFFSMYIDVEFSKFNITLKMCYNIV